MAIETLDVFGLLITPAKIRLLSEIEGTAITGLSHDYKTTWKRNTLKLL